MQRIVERRRQPRAHGGELRHDDAELRLRIRRQPPRRPRRRRAAFGLAVGKAGERRSARRFPAERQLLHLDAARRQRAHQRVLLRGVTVEAGETHARRQAARACLDGTQLPGSQPRWFQPAVMLAVGMKVPPPAQKAPKLLADIATVATIAAILRQRQRPDFGEIAGRGDGDGQPFQVEQVAVLRCISIDGARPQHALLKNRERQPRRLPRVDPPGQQRLAGDAAEPGVERQRVERRPAVEPARALRLVVALAQPPRQAAGGADDDAAGVRHDSEEQAQEEGNRRAPENDAVGRDDGFHGE